MKGMWDYMTLDECITYAIDGNAILFWALASMLMRLITMIEGFL